jgi:uncharacterized protein YkwD
MERKRAQWTRQYLATAVLAFSIAATGCTDDGDEGIDDGTESDSGRSGSPADDVPSVDYCKDVKDWSAARRTAEQKILALVNAERARGAKCGDKSFGPAPAIKMHPALRCAARVHTADMAANDFFDHTNQKGEAPWTRMEHAGYTWAGAGENIAGGQRTPEDAMKSWMKSPGHCSNIMNPGYVHFGIGYVDGANLWTQTFASPR